MDNDPPSQLKPTDPDELWDAPSVNQLVAYNMTRARRSRGWTQQEVAERLERYTGRAWSKASISAAERSWQGGRPRKFDANELVALAVIFETPVSFFLLPMETGTRAILMAQPEDVQPDGVHWLGAAGLLKRVLMDEMASPGGSEFALRAQAAVREHMEAEWHPPVFLDSSWRTTEDGPTVNEKVGEVRSVSSFEEVRLIESDELTDLVERQVTSTLNAIQPELVRNIALALSKGRMTVVQSAEDEEDGPR